VPIHHLKKFTFKVDLNHHLQYFKNEKSFYFCDVL